MKISHNALDTVFYYLFDEYLKYEIIFAFSGTIID